MNQWKAVFISAHEKKVIPLIEEAFEEHQIEVYSPRVHENTFHQYKKKFIESDRCIFPHILMVRFHCEEYEPWFELGQFRYVKYVLNGRVTQEEIDRIKDKEQELNKKTEREIGFVIGDKVRVVHGGMAGAEGVVEAVHINKAAVEVATIMFGRKTLIEVGVDSIEKID